MSYTRNRSCGCTRCRCIGLMWPTMLVLLGALFLLDNFHLYSFDKTWPLILIVAGAVWIFQSSASTAGHAEPGPSPLPMTPLPPSPSPAPDDKQVHHG